MKKLSLFAAGLLFSAGVLAGAADNVAVQDPYVRLAPPNAPATGAFMVIKNNGDKDIKVLMLPPDAHRAINALQRSAIVVLQKSLKEGFGLTVTEALWKGKPVVGGACGGITLQVHDYHTGFLVHSPPGAAYRIRYLLRYNEKRRRMGRTGQEFVREHFLLVRHLRDYLTMLLSLAQPEGENLIV